MFSTLRPSFFAGTILLCVGLATGCDTPFRQQRELPNEVPTLAAVIDGDTVIVEFPSGVSETVRLLGIDTPETVDPNRPEQCFGREASTHLSEILPNGAALRLERDVEARDHYGRLLAYIYRVEDDLFVNLDLVARGLADVSLYEPNTTYRREFDHAVLTARTQALGLWAACGGPDVALDPPENR